MTDVPAEFRAKFEAWWDALIVEGERRKYPYLPDQELMNELDAMPGDSTERLWIQAILVDWLGSTDTLRWQPSLGLLRRERVPGASSAMRKAVSPPNTADKRALQETFKRIADELDEAS